MYRSKSVFWKILVTIFLYTSYSICFVLLSFSSLSPPLTWYITKVLNEEFGNKFWMQFGYWLWCMHAKSLQSCPTLCNPMDWSPPGSSDHGILQARILKWVCYALLQGSFSTREVNPRLLHCQAGSLPLAPPGKPIDFGIRDKSLNFFWVWFFLLFIVHGTEVISQ